MRMWLLTALLLLAGCAEDAPDVPDVEVEDEPEPAILQAVSYHNTTGSVTGLNSEPAPPLVDGVQTHPFEVPVGTVRLDAFIAWSDPVAELQLTIPGLETSTTSGDGLVTVTAHDPPPGSYTAYVGSDLAAMVGYDLSIRFSPDPDASNFLSATATIPPGAFFEINLANPNGTTLHWDWSASSRTDFNLHTHFDGEVDYVVRHSGTVHRDDYAIQREGGHSLMWENPGQTPQSVQYRVWGAFTVDSYFPPR